MSRRAAIVTGASSGIGREVAVQAARAGWSLAITGRSQERLSQTAEMLELHDDALAVCIQADLTHEGAAEHVATAAMEAMGRIDDLVSVAGMADLVPFPGETRAHLEETMLVNAVAPAELICACWQPLMQGDPGRVVVFSSMSASDPFVGLGGYGMAKSAAEGLVRAVHSDSEQRIVSVGIAPGAVETPILRGLVDEQTLPPEHCMSPDEPAGLVMEILHGSHDVHSGHTLILPGNN